MEKVLEAYFVNSRNSRSKVEDEKKSSADASSFLLNGHIIQMTSRKCFASLQKRNGMQKWQKNGELINKMGQDRWVLSFVSAIKIRSFKRHFFVTFENINDSAG